jgi:hypothetical protein
MRAAPYRGASARYAAEHVGNTRAGVHSVLLHDTVGETDWWNGFGGTWIATGVVYAPRPVPGCAGAVRAGLFLDTMVERDRWNPIGGTRCAVPPYVSWLYPECGG